jgi:hypothetical protein
MEEPMEDVETQK